MATRIHSKTDGEKFHGESEFVIVSCSCCGIPYAIPDMLDKSAKRYRGDRPNGWRLHCPLGHNWWYVGETSEQQARRLLREEREHLASLRARLDQEKAHSKAMKGVATRRKKQLLRVKAGVCPCCNRTFQNLARHMAGQHPDYDPGAHDR